MRVSSRYNNLGLEALSMMFILKESGAIPVSKILLVLPITTHKEMLNHLANVRVEVQSFERYIIERMSYFSNFNDRYYDNLISGINAIQLLFELGVIKIANSVITPVEMLDYSSSMGARAKKISKASHNISRMLAADTDVLHLNLRIEL